MVEVSTCTGAEEVINCIGDGEVVPTSIIDGVDDGETTTTGVEDGETTGEVVPDSIGENAEGVTESTTGVERGVVEGTTTGELLCTGALDAGAEQLDDGPGTQAKFIPTTPMAAVGPEGELG